MYIINTITTHMYNLFLRDKGKHIIKHGIEIIALNFMSCTLCNAQAMKHWHKLGIHIIFLCPLYASCPL